MCVGRTETSASVMGLPVSAGGVTALSVAAGSSLVGPAKSVPGILVYLGQLQRAI